jgi:hypothetical protein
MSSPSTVVVEHGGSTTPVVQTKVKRRWVSYIWNTFDKSPEERRLLFKLDSAILTFASLGKCQWRLTSLDKADQIRSQGTSSSIWTKLTSTMRLCLGCTLIFCNFPCQFLDNKRFRRKEDLGMYGNQLNYMQTCWTVGYVIGEIPSNILLTRVRPRYWIPAAEVMCNS